MNRQGHLVTRLQGCGPPPNARQVLGARHLNAPLNFAASLRLDKQLDEYMGIGPAEILDGASHCDQLRLVEHRKRMVRKRRACRQHCSDGDEGIFKGPTHLSLPGSGFLWALHELKAMDS